MDETQIYEIEDGVRRAKTAWLLGHKVIEARIGAGPVLLVPIRNLRSPHKDSIEVSGLSGFRWDRVVRATKAGAQLLPIDVVPGNRGLTIAEVSVPHDELDMFR